MHRACLPIIWKSIVNAIQGQPNGCKEQLGKLPSYSALACFCNLPCEFTTADSHAGVLHVPRIFELYKRAKQIELYQRLLCPRCPPKNLHHLVHYILGKIGWRSLGKLLCMYVGPRFVVNFFFDELLSSGLSFTSKRKHKASIFLQAKRT